jgi:orotidine-5'-phosphate decarboxylase
MKLVDDLGDTCRWFKVGMELYYAAGNHVVQQLRDRGFNVFLDLKLHDIPNTVAGAVRSATQAGASLLTIHASGGAAMMAAAAEAASAPGSPRLLAVTVLTSMDASELAGIGITASAADQVLRLARLSRASGIDGMVCSAEEVAMLRRETSPDTLLVIPGIRPAGSAVGDQKRVATPGQAIADGASMLVVGRPITRAADPAAAAQAILKEIEHTAQKTI